MTEWNKTKTGLGTILDIRFTYQNNIQYCRNIHALLPNDRPVVIPQVIIPTIPHPDSQQGMGQKNMSSKNK